MLQRILCTGIIFILLSVPLRAQMERTIYQTYEIDSAEVVRLDLVGFTHVELLVWAGNTILSEVTIQLWDASPAILNYFVDKGRYQFAFEKNGAKASISTQVRERKVIKTKLSGPAGCQEITTLKLFIPDTYEWSAQLEEDSDGSITENTPIKLHWSSGYLGSGSETFEDRNKHKIIKTLRLKQTTPDK